MSIHHAPRDVRELGILPDSYDSLDPKEFMRALGGAIRGCCSVKVRTAHDPLGHRQRRFAHTRRTGRPNAGRSVKLTSLVL